MLKIEIPPSLATFLRRVTGLDRYTLTVRIAASQRGKLARLEKRYSMRSPQGTDPVSVSFVASAAEKTRICRRLRALGMTPRVRLLSSRAEAPITMRIVLLASRDGFGTPLETLIRYAAQQFLEAGICRSSVVARLTARKRIAVLLKQESLVEGLLGPLTNPDKHGNVWATQAAWRLRARTIRRIYTHIDEILKIQKALKLKPNDKATRALGLELLRKLWFSGLAHLKKFASDDGRVLLLFLGYAVRIHENQRRRRNLDLFLSVVEV